MGRLSSAVSNSQSRVTMQQEKSLARFSTPERPVRRRVFPILRHMPPNLLERIASFAPSSLFFIFLSIFFSKPYGEMMTLLFSVNRKLAWGSTTIVVNSVSIIAGPEYVFLVSIELSV